MIARGPEGWGKGKNLTRVFFTATGRFATNRSPAVDPHRQPVKRAQEASQTQRLAGPPSPIFPSRRGRAAAPAPVKWQADFWEHCAIC